MFIQRIPPEAYKAMLDAAIEHMHKTMGEYPGSLSGWKSGARVCVDGWSLTVHFKLEPLVQVDEVML